MPSIMIKSCEHTTNREALEVVHRWILKNIQDGYEQERRIEAVGGSLFAVRDGGIVDFDRPCDCCFYVTLQDKGGEK